jgi:D-alanyl-D-alanine carboxypeptidase/D-alanyl-D-alanine-endopeptidase (penicillin-binding protein 4)
MMRAVRVEAVASFFALVAPVAAGAAPDAERLRFVAIDGDGAVVTEQHADDPVNPASVVKVGTTLWALDRLGPDHRYTTTFGVSGRWDRASGVLVGDLVVAGAGDPDFQWENAYLVARELNRLGLRRVEGELRVEGIFWSGWEHGVEKRAVDPDRRGRQMGRRLIDALDPRRWTTSHENTWIAMCERRGWDPSLPPRVVVTEGVRVDGDGQFEPVLAHRSNRLPQVLRRFNVYSNNDIVRIADGLGSIHELEAFIARRLGDDKGSIVVATASGERRNRMSVRQMVALVRALGTEAVGQGIELRQLLPVVGCDPGPTRRMFPVLAAPPLTGSVVCKTGTLTDTDGGVAVLAGTYRSPRMGPVAFAVAAPEAGGRLQHWRRVEQRWLLSLMAEHGGAVAKPCGPELPFSDANAEIEPLIGVEGRD